jgi:DNA helicase HerA-like ATPase
MLKDNMIFLGKAGDKEINIIPRQMNRHGLIAGASGTGKTVTLKVIAESLSELGVPTFIADVKGDLSGMIVEGSQEGIQGRLDSMNVTDFTVRKYPVHFFDVYREKGHPIRTVMQDMDPLLLSRILDLSDVQRGVLNIIFKVAEDMELDIIDLKDLQAMTTYVGDHAKEFTTQYGNVSRQSVGAIQRKLLELDQQEGELMFGMPQLSIDDLIAREGGMGIMNILECQELFLHPMLYSTFLLWLLDKLYKELPEVGDLDKPKIIFFFDEAHLLFDNA